MIISLLLLTSPIVAFKIMEASFEITPDEMTDFFKEKPQQPNFGVYTTFKQEMFYAETGSDTNQMVLFVHGAPGSWDAFMKYLGDTALMRRAHLISVDRPEWAAKDWLAGLILVLTWPLVWGAVSGMETVLFAALVMAMK